MPFFKYGRLLIIDADELQLREALQRSECGKAAFPNRVTQPGFGIERASTGSDSTVGRREIGKHPDRGCSVRYFIATIPNLFTRDFIFRLHVEITGLSNF